MEDQRTQKDQRSIISIKLRERFCQVILTKSFSYDFVLANTMYFHLDSQEKSCDSHLENKPKRSNNLRAFLISTISSWLYRINTSFTLPQKFTKHNNYTNSPNYTN